MLTFIMLDQVFVFFLNIIFFHLDLDILVLGLSHHISMEAKREIEKNEIE